MAISTADIRGVFTKTLVDVYQDRLKPTPFLQSFFPVQVVPTKEFSIEVQRIGEKVAVDVVRGTEGNRNTFYKSTEKLFEPPLFREYFDMTELDLYDRVLGSQGNAQVPLFNALVNDAANKMEMLVDKIVRAKELQCAQILKNGLVSLAYGSAANIDYKRKAASIVDVPGDYFAAASDPFATLLKGCTFLRQTGKSGDAIFNAILGEQALTDLLANTKFNARQNLFNMALDQVHGPQRGAEGMAFHGTVTAGSYKVQLWTYPQFYDAPTLDINGAPTGFTQTAYWDTKSVVLIPQTPRFKMVHCAVPQLIGEPGQMPTQGEYVFMDFIDIRNAKHVMDVQSAPVAIPVAVDQIYTFKAVA